MQVHKILAVFHKFFHVDVMVILFARITDMECVHWHSLMGHVSFDKDGNNFVEGSELARIVELQDMAPDLDLWCYEEGEYRVEDADLAAIRYLNCVARLGHSNMFNPLIPEGEYILNLAVPDERRVAQFLGACMEYLPSTHSSFSCPRRVFKIAAD